MDDTINVESLDTCGDLNDALQNLELAQAYPNQQQGEIKEKISRIKEKMIKLGC